MTVITFLIDEENGKQLLTLSCESTCSLLDPPLDPGFDSGRHILVETSGSLFLC